MAQFHHICFKRIVTRFHFPSKPQRTLEEKAQRAIVPISIENIKSCDCILIGTADPRELRQFMEKYNANVSKLGFEGRKKREAVLDQESLEQILSTDRYHVKNLPIPLGAVRLLRSTVATSSRGSRYALQPQLLQGSVQETMRRRLVHFYYARLTMKQLPDHFDALRTENAMLRAKLFNCAGAHWEGDSPSLQYAMLQVHQNWPMTIDTGTPTQSTPCPVQFTEDEIRQCMTEMFKNKRTCES
ncbi:hypothetical protein PISL3812_02875 [Talaromyces islandicus]|uniref:Uncharacterized protein n=1 Tax=Talaromyces islandicus TaxID=28573 RepID=A0A0U1LRV5_TALIS|nr:hypothetical protein PISL3812_02875 [Talaromyces islandicus]